jgi:hypothetical protein
MTLTPTGRATCTDAVRPCPWCPPFRDPVPVRIYSHLAAGGLSAANDLLEGLLQSHPQQAISWLAANITKPDVAWLAVSAGDQLPPNREIGFLDAIIASVTVSDNPPGAESEPDRTRLTIQLVAHVGWCRADPRDRLARLVTLGHAAPAAALPRVLGAIDHILDSGPGQDTG